VCAYIMYVPLLTDLLHRTVTLSYTVGHPNFTFNAEILVHILPALRPIVVPYMLLNDLRHSMQQLYIVQELINVHMNFYP